MGGICLSEDILKKTNIKKRKSARHIHFAVVANTGELVSIESVQSGLACVCVCAACEKPMEARKGSIRRHHFAHVSNYDCLYGFEISIYRAFCSILMEKKKLLLPDAVLSFNSYKKDEIVKHAFLQELTDVSYHCAKGQYPPLLICHVGEYKLQILLDFDNYYDKQDLECLKQTAKENGMALLLIDIPEIDGLATLDGLMPYAVDFPKNKEWIYNRNIEDYDNKYREAAIRPAEFFSGTVCLAQKNRYKNVYSARWEDCVECEYCYDIDSENLCLAHSYINHVEDFRKPLAERRKTFEKANRIEPIKKISEYKCPVCKAPLRRINGKSGIFAGCSNYPQCKKTYSVEPTTEQLIINEYKSFL